MTGTGGNGNIRFDDSNPNIVDRLTISDLDGSGINQSDLISSLKTGDLIYIAESDGSRFFTFRVVNFSDQTTYFRFNVEFIDGSSSVPSNNAILSVLFVPSGTQGIQGRQGTDGSSIQGTQGAQGNKGQIGNQGRQGVQGTDGTLGSIGPQGRQGTQGLKGEPGNPGNDSTVAGPQGPQGSQGPQGPQGIQGLTGISGNTGGIIYRFNTNLNAGGTSGSGTIRFNNATPSSVSRISINDIDDSGTNQSGLLGSLDSGDLILIAQSDGSRFFTFRVTGKEDNGDFFRFDINFVSGSSTRPPSNSDLSLLFSLAGVQGIKGDQGDQGIKGDDGNQGSKGDQGPRGFQGIQGTQGRDGASITGAQGTRGLQGVKGVQGGTASRADSALQLSPRTESPFDTISNNGIYINWNKREIRDLSSEINAGSTCLINQRGGGNGGFIFGGSDTIIGDTIRRNIIKFSQNSEGIGDIIFTGIADTTVSQNRGIVWSSYDKQATDGSIPDDFCSIKYINGVTNSASGNFSGLGGSVLEIKTRDDVNDGVNFNVSSINGVKIKGQTVINAGNISDFLTGNNPVTPSNSVTAERLFKSLNGNNSIRVEGRLDGNASVLEISTGSTQAESILVRQYNNTSFNSNSSTRTFTILDSNGNSIAPGDLTIGGRSSVGTTINSNYRLNVGGKIRTTDDIDTFGADHQVYAGAMRAFEKTDGTGKESVFSNGVVEVGRNDGSVALTINDGGGNASVTFNHRNKKPDRSAGSSARITSSVDSVNGSLLFQVGNSTQFDTSVNLSNILNLKTDVAEIFTDLNVSGNIKNGGFDFILGNTDQSQRGNSGESRAIVKQKSNALVNGRINTNNSKLIFNFNEDFKGGSEFDGIVAGAYFAALRIERQVTENILTGLSTRTRLIAAKNISFITFGSTKMRIGYANRFSTNDIERIRYAHTGMARDEENAGINIVGPQGQSSLAQDDRDDATTYAFYGLRLVNQELRYATVDSRFMDEICVVVHYIPSSIVENAFTQPANEDQTLNTNAGQIPTDG